MTNIDPNPIDVDSVTANTAEDETNTIVNQDVNVAKEDTEQELEIVNDNTSTIVNDKFNVLVLNNINIQRALVLWYNYSFSNLPFFDPELRCTQLLDVFHDELVDMFKDTNATQEYSEEDKCKIANEKYIKDFVKKLQVENIEKYVDLLDSSSVDISKLRILESRNTDKNGNILEINYKDFSFDSDNFEKSVKELIIKSFFTLNDILNKAIEAEQPELALELMRIINFMEFVFKSKIVKLAEKGMFNEVSNREFEVLFLRKIVRALVDKEAESELVNILAENVEKLIDEGIDKSYKRAIDNDKKKVMRAIQKASKKANRKNKNKKK